MKITDFSFDQVGSFAKTDTAYQNGDDLLRPFYKYEPTISSFQKIITDKKLEVEHRSTLVEVLKEQYEKAGLPIAENIIKLGEENAFTVTTAHQPSLFTGPLYVILKIAGAINLSRKLNKELDSHIVPVYVIGGEDHDFDEINHLNVFGNTVVWKNETGGSVGRLPLSGLDEVIEKLNDILGDSENAQKLKSKISKAIEGSNTYGQVAFKFIHSIFENTELVILQMDHPKLKSHFKEIIKKEIIHQESAEIVRSTQEKLTEAGFQAQAFVREINFFYLTPGGRNRIEKNGDSYHVIDTDIIFNEEELLKEIENYPENFSPNVIVRPLFQELILPNLAYIGGGGEIAYWLERKSQFAHFGINFPMLVRRNSILWMDKGSDKQWTNLELSVEDLFIEEESLVKRWVKDHTEAEMSIEAELQLVEQAFNQIAEKAKEIDPTLAKAIAAEKTKVLKTTDQLGGRLLRAQKQKHEVTIGRIRKTLGKLFPDGGLQERSENFMSIYLRNGDEMISYLIEHLNPLEKSFKVFQETD